MFVLGVDPGVTGAAVLVDTTAMEVVDWLDLPIVRDGETVWVDGALVLDWIEERPPTRAIFERVNYWKGDPHPGRTSIMIGIARSMASLLLAANVPVNHIQPSAWKKRAGLKERSEAAAISLARARLRWPEGGCHLIKHHNRAEAALIAVHGPTPTAPPKPPRRSKTVDRLAAENLPAGPLFRGA